MFILRARSLTSDYMDLDIITFVILSKKIRAFVSHYRYIENITRKAKPAICNDYLQNLEELIGWPE